MASLSDELHSNKPTRLRVIFLASMLGLAVISLISFLYLWRVNTVLLNKAKFQPSQGNALPTNSPESVRQFQKEFQQAKIETWSFATQQISSQIMAVEKTKSSFLLSVTWPPSAPIHGKTIWVKIICPAEEVKVEGSDSKDLFAEANKNDYFYGFCDDINCQSISRGCDLQKYAR